MTDVHMNNLTRLFPFHYIVYAEKGLYVAKAAHRGYVDLAPNATLATLCQQVIDVQGGVGSFMLKDLALPAGLTYNGTMHTAELYQGILAHYTNGVPQSGTAYARTNVDDSIDYLVVINGHEIILETALP